MDGRGGGAHPFGWQAGKKPIWKGLEGKRPLEKQTFAAFQKRSRCSTSEFPSFDQREPSRRLPRLQRFTRLQQWLERLWRSRCWRGFFDDNRASQSSTQHIRHKRLHLSLHSRR